MIATTTKCHFFNSVNSAYKLIKRRTDSPHCRYQPFKCQSHKIVKHTQRIPRGIADELCECVWPFAWLALKVSAYSQVINKIMNVILCSKLTIKTTKRGQFQANIYFFNVHNKNIKKQYEICSKLTIKTPERYHSGIFIANFEHIPHLFLVPLLLTLNKSMLAGFMYSETYLGTFQTSIMKLFAKIINT